MTYEDTKFEGFLISQLNHSSISNSEKPKIASKENMIEYFFHRHVLAGSCCIFDK